MQASFYTLANGFMRVLPKMVMPWTMGIEAIAILGRQNEPLSFKNLSKEKSDFDSEGLLFMSLDHLRDKMKAQKGGEAYLGLYYFLDHMNFYAYCSTTLIKVIILHEWTESPPKDLQIKSILHRVYSLYVDIKCNPFHEDGHSLNAIESDKILQTLKEK